MIPDIEIAVKMRRKVQWMFILPISPKNPINELMAIMNNEVPMAVFMGSLASKTRMGIMINPPPEPTSPVIIPVNNPNGIRARSVSYTHLRAHETDSYLVCRLLLEKKKKKT